MKIFLLTILFLFPYFFLFYSKNYLKDFFNIFVFSSLFYLIISLVTQYFSVFSYNIVLILVIICNILIFLYFYYKRGKRKNFKINLNKDFFKKNIFFILSLLIISFQLYSVHFNFSGQLNTVHGHIEVENRNLPFPYYSDEYVGVAMVNEIIDTKSLVNYNPIMNGGYGEFPNIFIAFFSIISLPLLLSGMPVVFSYTILSIIIGILTCIIFYFFLRSFKLNRYLSSLGMLLVPYITISGNVPGLWNLIPFSLGLIYYFTSIIFVNKKWSLLLTISSFLTILIYPPFVALVLPTLILYYFKNRKNLFFKKYSLHILLLLVLAPILIFILQKNNLEPLLNILKNSIWRDNPEPGWQPRHPWFMLPNFVWSIALLAFIPLISKFKKNSIIILNIFIISFLWIFSSIHFKHFIFLDIAKVSVIGSYFLILMFVLALSYLYNYLKKNTNILSKEIIFVIIFFTYLFAILSLSSYTKLDKWKNLTLIADRVYTPTAPATEFLKERDLEVFSQFKHKRFISHPFKSLVIAATTLNYPLNSKTSIISNRVYYYQDFIKLNCQEMSEVAEKYNLDYVYLPFLSCPQFKFIEEGGDRFKLYEYISE